jgi:hypothetical protein
VGESGNLDFLVYLKGNLGDFDNWVRNTKDSSLKYDNLLQTALSKGGGHRLTNSTGRKEIFNEYKYNSWDLSY